VAEGAALKIAVVSIALNEAKFVERWAGSAADADLLVIGDTGSTDATVATAKDLGITVHEMFIRPWRFDTARNTLLALIPPDIDCVINLDLDEILVEGWRAQLEAAPRANRYSNDYVFSWTADGQPDIRFMADKVHSRFGWTWKHPCHESLYPVGDQGPTVPGGFAVHHHPDPGKSRGQYLELLALATAEDPANARMAHYYARELYFHGNWTSARKEFVRHLSLPDATWPAERAQSLRYIAKMDDYPERWLWKAVGEDLSRRDAMVDLVDLYVEQGRLLEAAGVARRALRIAESPGDYMTTLHAYDDGYLRSVIKKEHG
jgi:glycosyltransferase involved in cell wall biosynthesis